MIYKESAEQIAFFKWARNPLILKKYPQLELIYCNHNTQMLTKPQAARWKALGGCKGIPDVFLSYPANPWESDFKNIYNYMGLYLEFKNPDLKPKTVKGKGGVSAEQAIMFDKLKKAGYQVSIVYSCNEAIKVIEKYLS